MPILYRASFGYLLRHPWQLALALIGIGIGVAVIVAVDLANQSSRKAFFLSMDALTGKATHQVIGGPGGIDEKLYVRLRTMHGIRNIAPIVEGYVRVNDASVRILGVDLFAERQMRSFAFGPRNDAESASISSQTLFRNMLTEPGASLMSHNTAAALTVAAGAAFSVSASGRSWEARHAGWLDQSAASQGSAALDDLVVVDIATAQMWLNSVGRLSRIDVRIADGDERATDSLKATLPAGYQLLSAHGRTRTLAEMSVAFTTNLSAMSLLAMLVGVFLIYNSVGFAVVQRRGLIGVLRAIGVTRQQIYGLILGEAALLGLVGAALGVAFGIFLGEQLLTLVARSINDFYFRVSVSAVSVDPVALGKGVLAGLGATLVAAAAPAIEAASYQPTLALRRSVLEHRTGRLLPIIAVAGICLGALAVVLLRWSGSSLVAGLAAVFMLILGFALLVPLAVKTVTSLLAPVVGRLAGTSARLAVSGIGASLSRTGVAVVALAVAVSATIGVSVMVDSFRSSVSDWLDNTLQSDVYVGVPRGAMQPDLVEEMLRVPGVVAHSTSRRVWLENATGRTRVIAVQMAPGRYAGTEVLDDDPKRVWQAFEEDGAVLVSEPYAYRNQVSAGELIRLMTDSGERDFAVAATYQSYDVNAGAVLMSRATYDRFWDDPKIDSIGLFLDPGTSADEAIARLKTVSAGRQQVFMRSNHDIRDLSLRLFDRTFVITDVLYWLAIGVALIGILGAMLALQLERARELAVLRALGMTPAQLGSMMTLQTSLIGLLSGLAAIPLGLVMAWMLIEVINRRAFGWQMDVSVSPQILVSAVLFSIGAAAVAGIYPAWRAARSLPALAMREE
jgi:putative ABC transport system permease protein